MLTKVQWADAFRRGLFADGKYRSGLLEDHDKRLNFSSKFGSSCTLLCSKGQWMLLRRQQFLFFIMWKNTNLFYLLWIVVYIKTWNYVLLGSWEKIYLHFCKKKKSLSCLFCYILTWVPDPDMSTKTVLNYCIQLVWHGLQLCLVVVLGGLCFNIIVRVIIAHGKVSCHLPYPRVLHSNAIPLMSRSTPFMR